MTQTEIRRLVNIIQEPDEAYRVKQIGEGTTLVGEFDNIDKLMKVLKNELHENMNDIHIIVGTCPAIYEEKNLNKFRGWTEKDDEHFGIVNVKSCNFFKIILSDRYNKNVIDEDYKMTKEVSIKAKQIQNFFAYHNFYDPLIIAHKEYIEFLYSIDGGVNDNTFDDIAVSRDIINIIFDDETFIVDMQNTLYPEIKVDGRIIQAGSVEVADEHLIYKLGDIIPETSDAPAEWNDYNPKEFSLEEFLKAHDVEYKPLHDIISYSNIRWKRYSVTSPFSKNKALLFESIDEETHRIQFVDFEIYTGQYHQDAFRKYYYMTDEERENLMREIAMHRPNEARESNVDKITPYFTLQEIDAQPDERETFIDTGIRGIDIRTGGLAKGQISIMAGNSGCGKSSLTAQFIADAIETGNSVFLCSAELTGKRIQKWFNLNASGPAFLSRMVAANGREYYIPRKDVSSAISEQTKDQLVIYNNNHGLKQDDLKSAILTCMKKRHLDLIIIDNLMALDIRTCKTEYSEDKYDIQTNFVKDLKQIAETYNVHIMLCAHPRKSSALIRVEDISGTGNLRNLVDTIFLMHRVSDDFKLAAAEYFHWELPDYLKRNSGKQKNNDEEDEEKRLNPVMNCDNAIEIYKDREGGSQSIFVPLYFEPASHRMQNERGEAKTYGQTKFLHSTI